MVLLGDFNTVNYDVPNEMEASCIRTVLDWESPAFCSAYPLPQSPGDAQWSTWKRRKDVTKKQMIDYIFHSKALSVRKRLDVPDGQLLDPWGLPSQHYPSDHLALAVVFELNNAPGT